MTGAAPFPSPTYPTPLRRCPELETEHGELWIKNDGLSHPTYGGNKVRKLERFMADARARGASRVLTFGAAGSHHVLTTALFARASGMRAAALLTPQHATPHARDTLRAALAQGLEAFPVPDPLALPRALRRAWRPGDYVIAPGGSSVLGTVAYHDAVVELSEQLRLGSLPTPDVLVVPLGSGGTCAGLLAGVAACGLATRVIGVLVVRNPGARWLVQALAAAALRRLGARARVREAPLEIEAAYVGAGYGIPTAAGQRALEVAARVGLELDPTYTAKAFAKVLDLLQARPVSPLGRRLRVLYWHTLSAVPIAPLLRDGDTLPAELAALLQSPARPM